MSLKKKAILFSYRHENISKKLASFQSSIQDLKKNLSYVKPQSKK